jgi:glycerol-1-phosphate dehydrogenase [NAD(P)+]
MQTITETSKYLSLEPSQLADTIFHCPECGRDHVVPFKLVRADGGLIQNLSHVVQKIHGSKPSKIGVIYDRAIEEKLDQLFFKSINTSCLSIYRIPLGNPDELLEPSVGLGDQTAEKLPADIDVLIGVGSGVISDLTKWVANQLEADFILMGTAGSMNAYTSITGTITENRVKRSKWLNPASAVLLDTALMASAPKGMTCAGVGDLLARNVANADWKLSHLLRDTYFCSIPFKMMVPYQKILLRRCEDLGENDPRAIHVLSEAIIMSGYSMTVLNGETSPSSGSEHVISHFFDYQHEIFNKPKNLHGTQVGVGTIIMSTAYEVLREFDASDFDIDEMERRRLSLTAINLGHKRVFGEHAPVLNAVVQEKRIPEIQYRNYIEQILNSWDSIWEQIDPYLMPSGDIRQVMNNVDGVTTLSGVNRTEEDAVQALLYGPHYRPRYTVLDLFWELGLFPDIALDILERSGVL